MKNRSAALSIVLKILLVIGGHDGGSYLDSTELFDANVGGWITGAALPNPMSGLKAANIDNRVHIFGIY